VRLDGRQLGGGGAHMGTQQGPEQRDGELVGVDQVEAAREHQPACARQAQPAARQLSRPRREQVEGGERERADTRREVAHRET
jgi:hypothetical protein